MLDLKPKTIFTRIPALIAQTVAEPTENGKISDWLSALREKGWVRSDLNISPTSP